MYNISMDTRYVKNTGAVFSLKYHLVWCPKYRRPVLVADIASRLKVLLVEKANELEVMVHALEVMPNHVHLFIETDPRWCPAELANRFKGSTSHALREEFPSLKSRLPTLWSRSYFIGSVGSVTAASIEKYIASQKGK